MVIEYKPMMAQDPDIDPGRDAIAWSSTAEQASESDNATFEKRPLRHWLSTLFSVSLPAALWMITAAPTFYGDDARLLLALATPTTMANPSGSSQSDLLDSEAALRELAKSEQGLSNETDSVFAQQLHAARTLADRSTMDLAIEQIYIHVTQGQLSQALAAADRLIAKYPNFRVAHLIRGDLLLLKTGAGLQSIGNIDPPSPEKARELADLREEAMVRLRAFRHRPPQGMLPREIIQLRQDQRHVIVVDSQRSRLFLYENTQPLPRLVTDFYITQGKQGVEKEKEGDQKTPLGVYLVTDLLPKQKLTDFYGPLALPISYPNEWDRRQGRTGHGIWLHGIPSTMASRPPRASDGCVVLSNADMLHLRRYVNIGNTPVVIADQIEFVPAPEWQNERDAMLSLLEDWRRDFESAQPERLLSHYSTQGYIDGLHIDQWRSKVLAPKLAQSVVGNNPKLALEELSMLRYPARDDMMVVSFRQHIEVDGEVVSSRRRQYWVREGARWRIAHEVTVS